MNLVDTDPARIRSAWKGRISGCLLGKALELLSFRHGLAGLRDYLGAADALPLRDYVPVIGGTLGEQVDRTCCRGHIVRAEPDDDINYTVLAMLMLEDKGIDLATADVARAWLRLLPAGVTWTAERAAYSTLLANVAPEFVNGDDAGFDLAACSDNEYNQWIGARIRADLYGWVCPGRPGLAAELARRDAALSHRADGVYGAMLIAGLGASIPATGSLDDALEAALAEIPRDCGAAEATRFGRSLAGAANPIDRLHEHYEGLSAVHGLNNLALVVWALCSAEGDFSAAIGNAVMAGWDTDCNGATVGGLMGLSGARVPEHWTDPWAGKIGVSLAGLSELQLDDVVGRTVSVARGLEAQLAA
jgi:ADP-ribosylglycohydrolase